MTISTVDDWIRLADTIDATHEGNDKAMARRILGYLTHYRDGGAYENHDIETLANALVAYARLLGDWYLIRWASAQTDGHYHKSRVTLITEHYDIAGAGPVLPGLGDDRVTKHITTEGIEYRDMRGVRLASLTRVNGQWVITNECPEKDLMPHLIQRYHQPRKEVLT